jgi:putative ABC transport system ATP-binding protein
MSPLSAVEPTPTTASLTTQPAARLVDARKVYTTEASEVTALDGINLDLPRGAFTAIMGPSGSGKSTLMHCLAGLDRLTSGQVFLDDEDLTRLNDRELTLLRRSKIGFVFQSFNLIPSLSAKENVVLPLSLSGQAPDEAVFDDVVATLGLTERLHHRPAQLSGGQQQRVAVARALVAEPAVVFADEPTGNLDSRSGTEVLRFLREAVDERNQTTVMVTHDPTAAAWADRVIFLVDGRIDRDLTEPSSDDVIDVFRELGQ